MSSERFEVSIAIGFFTLLRLRDRARVVPGSADHRGGGGSGGSDCRSPACLYNNTVTRTVRAEQRPGTF